MNERTDSAGGSTAWTSRATAFRAQLQRRSLQGTVAADPNLWLLETSFPNLPAIGKNGDAFLINANFYRVVAVRMRTRPRPGTCCSLVHEHHARPAGPPDFEVVTTTPGWRIYFVDLATLGS